MFTKKIEIQTVTIRTTDINKISTVFKIIIFLTTYFYNNLAKQISLTYNLIKTVFLLIYSNNNPFLIYYVVIQIHFTIIILIL